MFTMAHTALCEKDIDTGMSGTTAVFLFFDNQDIVVANAGDSRMLLGSKVDPINAS
jgi:serine/threonine protein phosphatase PrpC